jgi:hypothetical protein
MVCVNFLKKNHVKGYFRAPKTIFFDIVWIFSIVLISSLHFQLSYFSLSLLCLYWFGSSEYQKSHLARGVATTSSSHRRMDLFNNFNLR